MRVSMPFFNRPFSFSVVYILLALLVVGAFIRFYKLDDVGLWLDEIFSMQESDPSSTFSEVYENIKRDQPPVFFFILHGWLKIFGYSDLAGRALTCVYGVGGILAMFFLGREFKDERVGLLAAFLTTINWYHISISQEIRFYSLVFLLSSLSYLFFLRSIRHQRTADFFCYAFITGALLNTHYYGLVLFCSQLLIFIIVIAFFKPNLRLIIGGAAAGIASGLTLLHWKSVIIGDLQLTSFHIPPLTIQFLLKFWWWYVYDPAAFLLYLLLGGIAMITLYNKIKVQTFTLEDFILLAWIIIGFAIPLLYSIIRMPLFSHRYCTIQFPALLLLVAEGWTHAKKRLQTYSGVIFVISACIVLFITRPPYRKSFDESVKEMALIYLRIDVPDKVSRREDWREVASFFARDKRDDRVLFSQQASIHSYYFKKFGIEPPLDQNFVDFSASLHDKQEVWLLINTRYKDSRYTYEFLPDQQRLVDQQFQFKDSVVFARSKALRYVRQGR